MKQFHHLQDVYQSYFSHMYDALLYSFISFQASFFFFVHAFYPDLFICHGSDTIHHLYQTIQKKKEYIMALKNHHKSI